MNFDRTNYKSWLAAAFGALLAAGLGLVLRDFTVGRGLITRSYDLLLVARGDVQTREAVIVYLDEASYSALQQPLNVPWDRALHARLIDRLTHGPERGPLCSTLSSRIPCQTGPTRTRQLRRR